MAATLFNNCHYLFAVNFTEQLNMMKLSNLEIFVLNFLYFCSPLWIIILIPHLLLVLIILKTFLHYNLGRGPIPVGYVHVINSFNSMPQSVENHFSHINLVYLLLITMGTWWISHIANSSVQKKFCINL